MGKFGSTLAGGLQGLGQGISDTSKQSADHIAETMKQDNLNRFREGLQERQIAADKGLLQERGDVERKTFDYKKSQTPVGYDEQGNPIYPGEEKGREGTLYGNQPGRAQSGADRPDYKTITDKNGVTWGINEKNPRDKVYISGGISDEKLQKITMEAENYASGMTDEKKSLFKSRAAEFPETGGSEKQAFEQFKNEYVQNAVKQELQRLGIEEPQTGQQQTMQPQQQSQQLGAPQGTQPTGQPQTQQPDVLGDLMQKAGIGAQATPPRPQGKGLFSDVGETPGVLQGAGKAWGAAKELPGKYREGAGKLIEDFIKERRQ